MATGDTNDMVFRIKANLPQHWFNDSTPILNAIINGLASTLAFIYSLINYARNQTRIATATDGFLDLISFDFFGLTLPRRPQEQDIPFRARILANLFPQRVTRAGMISTLQALTGRTPDIFEPARPMDTGVWSSPKSGWSSSGRWGSRVLPAQVFIVAYRPASSGIPYIAGWGVAGSGWSVAGQAKWSNLSEVTGFVTDADIYAAIAATKAEGTIAWVQLSN